MKNENSQNKKLYSKEYLQIVKASFSLESVTFFSSGALFKNDLNSQDSGFRKRSNGNWKGYIEYLTELFIFLVITVNLVFTTKVA